MPASSRQSGLAGQCALDIAQEDLVDRGLKVEFGLRRISKTFECGENCRVAKGTGWSTRLRSIASSPGNSLSQV